MLALSNGLVNGHLTAALNAHPPGVGSGSTQIDVPPLEPPDDLAFVLPEIDRLARSC